MRLNLLDRDMYIKKIYVVLLLVSHRDNFLAPRGHRFISNNETARSLDNSTFDESNNILSVVYIM